MGAGRGRERACLDGTDLRNSWSHRVALAALTGIEITLGISDAALRRAVREVGIDAIEREIEDARYGTFPTRDQPPRPPAIVRRGRRPA
jgi:hypothetical protein